MHQDFDDEMNVFFDNEYYPECFDCPYFYREFPGGPGRPPTHGGPGGPPTHGGPGGPPFHGGMEQHQHGQPPGAPPNITPHMNPQVGTYAVSPGSIQPCLYRYVYIWLENGRSFWAWLTRVDRRTASGYRWNGRQWVYFGVDLRSIESFQCY